MDSKMVCFLAKKMADFAALNQKEISADYAAQQLFLIETVRAVLVGFLHNEPAAGENLRAIAAGGIRAADIALSRILEDRLVTDI